jgi:hypothetical protein
MDKVQEYKEIVKTFRKGSKEEAERRKTIENLRCLWRIMTVQEQEEIEYWLEEPYE